MATETIPWDIQDYITTPERQLGYLEAALEDGDPALITAALADIAKARGMTAVAERAGLSRPGLYKALSPDGEPLFSTVLKVMKALGLRLAIAPAEAPAD